MRILWLCNIMLPQIAKDIGKPSTSGGGWLTGLSNDLQKEEKIQLGISFPILFEKNLLKGKSGNIEYYGFPTKKYNLEKYDDSIELSLEKIVCDFNPDIIHVFGTEYPHTLAMINACEKKDLLNKVVINIQGLVSVCKKHYCSSLPPRVVHGYTFRDLVKHDNIMQQVLSFGRRGNLEVCALKKVKHVIGRTDWDKACTEQINANLKYYFCNETLRDVFYKHTWDINQCEKYSIFVSQCSYPIKGFHFILEALPEVLKRYPNAHLYTTGQNPLLLSGKSRLRKTYYQKYIGKLIKKYNLQNHVTFLGMLDELQICERFLKSNVFVSPSSIENSPNSVGEAMCLGVPTVSSDVGGVKNILIHNVDGFIYQHDAPYMLAFYICQIFEDNDVALRFSNTAQEHAKHTHDKEVNLKNVIQIYETII